MAPNARDQKFTKQMNLLGNLQSFIQNSIEGVTKTELTIEYFKARLTLLEDYWSKFFERNDDLLSHLAESADHEYFKNNGYLAGEMAYIGAKSTLTQNINKLKDEDDNESVHSSSSSRTIRQNFSHQPFSHSLPKLQVPKFNGDQENWESFKELFTATVISDTRIPDVLKLQFLMNSVEGPAAQALKGIKVTSAYYKVAWEKLERRYDNKKIRLSAHFDAILNLPVATQKSAAQLSKSLDKIEESIKGLEELGCPIKEYDLWFVHLLVRCLDGDTRESWAIHQEKVQDFASYQDLVSFLEHRIHSLGEAKVDDQLKNSNMEHKQNKSNKSKSAVAHVAEENAKGKKSFTPCWFCEGKHFFKNCFKYLNLNIHERKLQVRKKKRCFNCLSGDHNLSDCTSKSRCFECKSKHHTSLHSESAQAFETCVSEDENSSDSQNGSDSQQGKEECFDSCLASSLSHSAYAQKAVLLATAQITLTNGTGDLISVRALIDPGSQKSFISKRVVAALGLPTSNSNVSVRGVGASVTATSSKQATLILKSRDNRFSVEFTGLILGKLTSILPQRKVKVENWHHLDNILLADPEFRTPKTIDCLLGADIYSQILLGGVRAGPGNSPIAQQTRLGWILTGEAKYVEDSNLSQHSGICVDAFFMQEDQAISETLAKLWEIEKIPLRKFLTTEEEECENQFKATVFQQDDGRYGVRLPFKDTPEFIGSLELAKKFWYKLEKRLAHDPALKEAYDAFLQEYLRLNHMEPVPIDQINRPNVFYIPHHAVFHNGKIRVVFHASMKSRNGVSLNDTLLVGQKLQQDIISVITRWRCYKIVFTCDIVKMFRQIAIHSDDRDWLRILYDFGQGLQHFRLNTVTYGTASAPYQSLRVLRQIIEDHCPNDDKMKELFYHLSYVDDFFGGADSREDALQIKNRLVDVLAKAQITLNKWASNDKTLLENLENINDGDKCLQIPDVVSALGLKWASNDDTFSFNIQPLKKGTNEVTKRFVLSESSKLFDPLGWLAPVLVSFKIFYQDLWIDGLEWDTPLSTDLREKWITFRKQVEELGAISIPRWFGGISNSSWSLHGFADASKRAYAACLYYVPATGVPQLICAKTRVAPVKTLTIPKLELTAAKLLADLIEFMLPSFPVQPTEIHCWSDSRNVLCLLKISPSKLQVFEANRVSSVITTLPQVRWKYVPTADNPADVATRGITAKALKDLSLWWSGPCWLPNKTSWPKQLDLLSKKPKTEACEALLVEKVANEPNEWISTFSSFQKAIRITAMCKRWLSFKNKPGLVADKKNGRLSAEEILAAERLLIKLDQKAFFNMEITNLIRKKEIPRKSKLSSLTPFLDETGLLRVGGRLSECPFLTFNEKHPVVLDKSSHLAKIIISDNHIKTLHGGPQLVLSKISRKFWIIHGKRVIKSVLGKCPRCLRYSGKCVEQQMAPLPKYRFNLEYPFASTGVDYAGPIKVTPSKRRGVTSTKGYIAIFICMVTKAVHVEIVSDLLSKTFLAAFERFCARRNLPKAMYSDNGTTFHGAEKEIKKLFSPSSTFINEVQQYTGNLGITWNFTPPYGPHFGGLWEAAVRSFKHHFKRVVGDSSFTFEELCTLAAQIEACLNSRPVCAISVDNRDPIPLTPGHFLVGRPLMTLPPSSKDSDITKSFSCRWLQLLAMRNNFAKRWRKEVLHQMMQRNKWQFPNRNLQVDDLVIMREDSTHPSTWPLGVIIEAHPDKSGDVRVVKVKTTNSTFERPISKLIYVPIEKPATEVYHSFLSICEQSDDKQATE